MIDPRHRNPECVEIERQDVIDAFARLVSARKFNDVDALISALNFIECMFERALEDV